MKYNTNSFSNFNSQSSAKVGACVSTQPVLTANYRFASPKPARRTIYERQAATRDADDFTVWKLWTFAREVKDMRAAKLAIKIGDSLTDSNQFTSTGFEWEGRRYNAASQLVVPPTRLSQAYLRRQGSARRVKIKKFLKTYRVTTGYSTRFYTLTIPNLKASFELTLDIIQDALIRLKRSKIWRENIKGAFDKIEWTSGKQFIPHNHTHAHVMVVARFLDIRAFTEVWTRCVRRAVESHGLKWQLPKGKFLSVHLKTKTIDEMIFEMTKYVAKPSDYARMDGAELVEIDRVLRGRRLLNSYGDFNKHKGNRSNLAKHGKNGVERTLPSFKTPTQLNNSTSGNETANPQKESWNEAVLDSWRKIYVGEMEAVRKIRLACLLKRHPRCVIKLKNGDEYRGKEADLPLPPIVV